MLTQNSQGYFNMKNYHGFTEKCCIGSMKAACFTPLLLLASLFVPALLLTTQISDFEFLFKFVFIFSLCLSCGITFFLVSYVLHSARIGKF
jgi:hypothetical protein